MKPCTISPVITNTELCRFCDTFLNVSGVPDTWCHNGLQIEGKKEIKKVALLVSSSKKSIQEAKKWGADAIIAHHGLLWGKGVQVLQGILAEKLQLLFEDKINLYAYHLPLDAHPEVGNNAQIAKALGAKSWEMEDICSVFSLDAPVDFTAFHAQCTELFGESFMIAENFSGDKVQKVGVCSGGGADYAEMLVRERGIDTFITGELSEKHWHILQELPVNIIAGGHYTTETFGIQALGKVLEEQFPDLEFSFFQERCLV